MTCHFGAVLSPRISTDFEVLVTIVKLSLTKNKSHCLMKDKQCVNSFEKSLIT